MYEDVKFSCALLLWATGFVSLSTKSYETAECREYCSVVHLALTLGLANEFMYVMLSQRLWRIELMSYQYAAHSGDPA